MSILLLLRSLPVASADDEVDEATDDSVAGLQRQMVVARARAMHPAGSGVDGGCSSPPSAP
jgi:hypothetical protein